MNASCNAHAWRDCDHVISALRHQHRFPGHPTNHSSVMPRRAVWLVSAIVLSLTGALTGCQTARYIVKDADHGVVSIPADGQNFPTDYRDDAALLMAEHFPEGYRLTGEELVRIGPDRVYHENLDQVSEGGGPLHILGRGTIAYPFKRERKEVHISYERLAPDAQDEP